MAKAFLSKKQFRNHVTTLKKLVIKNCIQDWGGYL